MLQTFRVNKYITWRDMPSTSGEAHGSPHTAPQKKLSLELYKDYTGRTYWYLKMAPARFSFFHSMPVR